MNFSNSNFNTNNQIQTENLEIKDEFDYTNYAK